MFLNRSARPRPAGAAHRTHDAARAPGARRHGRVRRASVDLYFGGDMEASIALSGQVVGRIDAVKPVAQIIDETMRGFFEVVGDLAERYAATAAARPLAPRYAVLAGSQPARSSSFATSIATDSRRNLPVVQGGWHLSPIRFAVAAPATPRLRSACRIDRTAAPA